MCPKYKTQLKIRKSKRSDIKWSNPYGNQTTHFVGYTESPNANNSYCNCKNTKTTSNAGPNICVSFIKKRKTQVGGCHYKMKSVKVNQNKQCSSQ